MLINHYLIVTHVLEINLTKYIMDFRNIIILKQNLGGKKL